MISEHLSTPVSTIETTIAPKGRSSRIRGVPQTARTEHAIQERKAKEAKKKKQRDSNVRRGEDAVKTRLESEEKAKKSGETSKTYKN